MGIQLFRLSHQLHGSTNLTDTFLVKMLEGDLATVTVQVDTIIGGGITVGRQRVVGTTGIVTGTLTGVGT